MKKIKGLDCILLVDDEKVNNFLNTRLIKKLEIDVHIEEALNGDIALEYLTTKIVDDENIGHYPQPGIIFLDINMPRMDGWEFLEEYTKLPEKKRAKIVMAMLTSSNNPDDINKAKKNGALIDYIKKPLTKEKLEGIIHKYFE